VRLLVGHVSVHRIEFAQRLSKVVRSPVKPAEIERVDWTQGFATEKPVEIPFGLIVLLPLQRNVHQSKHTSRVACRPGALRRTPQRESQTSNPQSRKRNTRALGQLD
jgi:hypothetical protein